MGSNKGPLIFLNSSGKFELDETTAAKLSKIAGGLVIVCVAGNYRTGKSFLLNCLHGSGGEKTVRKRDSGFAVGDSTNACTRGIWARWYEQNKVKCRDGSESHVVYLDTEGLAAVDQNHTHDTQIFALAVLLASCFVYNTTGTINEAALDSLAMVTHLAAKIYHSRSAPESSTKSAKSNDLLEFPHFMWVVRDFSLMLKDESGAPIGPDAYLENALREKLGDTEAAKAKNQIRSVFKEMFPDRACQTLVRPCTEEEDLQSLRSLDSPNIRPQFLAGIQRIKSWLSDRARPKTVGRVTLSGRMFVELARQYVDAINGGAIPNIATALENAITVEAKRAYEEALVQFHKTRWGSFSSSEQIGDLPFPVEFNQLIAAHDKAVEAARTHWSSRMPSVSRHEYLDRLNDDMAKLLAQAERENNVASTLHCRTCVDKLVNNLNEISANELDMPKLSQHVHDTVMEFLEHAKGPQFASVLREALLPQLVRFIASRVEANTRKMETAAANHQHALELIEKDLQASKSQIESLTRELEKSASESKRLFEEKTALQNEVSKLQGANLAQAKDLEALRLQSAQQNAALSAERTKTTQLEETLDASGKQFTKLKHDSEETQKRLDTITQECTRLQQSNEDLSSKLAEKIATIVKLQSEATSNTDKSNSLQDQLRGANAAKSELESELHQANTKLKQLTKELDQTKNDLNSTTRQFEAEKHLAQEQMKQVETSTKSTASKLSAELDREREKCTQLEKRLGKLQNEITQKEKEAASAAKQQDALLSDRDKRTAENQNLEKELQKLKNTVATLEHDRDTAVENATALETQKAQLLHNLSEAQNRVKDLLQKLETEQQRFASMVAQRSATTKTTNDRADDSTSSDDMDGVPSPIAHPTPTKARGGRKNKEDTQPQQDAPTFGSPAPKSNTRTKAQPVAEKPQKSTKRQRDDNDAEMDDADVPKQKRHCPNKTDELDNSFLVDVPMSPISRHNLARASNAHLVQTFPKLSESELNSMTIQELKSEMTKRNIDVPQTKMKKAEYVKLLLDKC